MKKLLAFAVTSVLLGTTLMLATPKTAVAQCGQSMSDDVGYCWTTCCSACHCCSGGLGC
jgi:hypothetical protein